jgi:hypothetical protein
MPVRLVAGLAWVSGFSVVSVDSCVIYFLF